MSSITSPSDRLTPDEMESAEEITVQKPGANMLWVTITWGNGETEQFSVKATPQNSLLYNRDQYEFQGKSLYTILFGDAHAQVVLSDDPYVAIKPGPYRDTYRLWFESDVDSVLTSPDNAHNVLKGIIELTDEDDPSRLHTLYTHILENQINRDAVLALYDNGHIPEDDRVELVADGVVVDGMLLLTWENEFYLYTETWKDGAFTPHGDPKEKPGEFREITVKHVPEPRDITVAGVTYHMTKQEHTFLRRLRWMLDWESHLDGGEVECMKRTIPIIQQHNL